MEKLILASSSPRRRELLGLMGIDFEIDSADVDETCALPAREAVAELSRRKARAVAARHPGKVILAADTLVAVDHRPLGKPADEEEAFQMLCRLRNRKHQVFTGVTVVGREGEMVTEVDASDVHFMDISDEEIRRYVATGEPMDKAGSYALQGAAGMWIDRVEGSYSGIIGLPMHLVRQLLARCGVEVLPAIRD